MKFQAKSPKGKRIWTPAFIHILLLYFAVQMVLYMDTPVLSKYILSISQSNVVVGIVAGVFSIFALMVRPFSGFFADKYSKKMVLIFSMIGTFLATSGYCIAQNTAQFIFFRTIHGISYAVSTTIMMAMVSDILDDSVTGQGIGYYALAATLAASAGPALGLKMIAYAGYRGSLLTASFFALLAAVLAVTLPGARGKAVPENRGRLPLTIKNLIAKEVVPLAGFACLFSFSNALISNYISILGESRNIGNIALYFTVNAVVMAVAKPLSGKLCDQYGLHYILYFAFAFSSIAMFLLVGAQSLGVILVVAVLYGIGVGAGQPAIQAQSIHDVAPEKVGIAVSTCYLGNDFGQGIGPMIGGSISDRLGYGGMYAVVGVIHLAAIALFAIYEKKTRVIDGIRSSGAERNG